MKSFDYIIIGGGASGLSLALQFCDDFFSNKSIIIIEKKEKNSNDRTWSSWVKPDDKFNHLAIQRWPQLTFYSASGDNIKLDAHPYEYRMIRSSDFYAFAHQQINNYKNIVIVKEEYISYEIIENFVRVHTDKTTYEAKHMFTSLYQSLPSLKEINYVDQHFKGWFIETPLDQFNSSESYFMDFRTPQFGETRFLYVLPLTAQKALIQVAIFSNNLLQQDEYDQILSEYIGQVLCIREYQILETEFGIIPMTSYNFSQYDTPYITHIGTAGGCVKPSSGYAFTRIQKHCEAITNCIKNGKPTSEAQSAFSLKHKILDDTMLDVLNKNKISGERFFTELFKLNKAKDVFDFLNESSSIRQELKIMNLPFKRPFIISFLKSLFKKANQLI